MINNEFKYTNKAKLSGYSAVSMLAYISRAAVSSVFFVFTVFFV